jgi:hypothetical protein
MRMERAAAVTGASSNYPGIISVARKPEEPAGTYGLIPYPPNTRFRGRSATLSLIHLNLAGKVAAKRGRSQHSVALYGMGGIGKTQIALKFVYDHQVSYNAIFWICADSETKLTEGYSEIAMLLGLEASKLTDQGEIVKEVRRWLRSNTDTWLMVFDNADDLEVLKKFWPPPAANSFVLMTTRDQRASRSPANKGIRIAPFDHDDAVEVFFSLLDRKDLDLEMPDLARVNSCDQTAPQHLVSELGMLPLAISQAAAYIARVGCSIETYCDMYKAEESPSGFLSSDRDTNLFYEHTVATTWNISFTRIEQQHPQSAQLLRV